MPDTTDPILDLERQLLREIRELEHQRQEARGIEWQASPRGIAEGRRGGTALHHDPTALIATDEHRLSVRDSLRNAEEDLIRARQHIQAARARVRRAVDNWRGPSPQG